MLKKIRVIRGVLFLLALAIGGCQGKGGLFNFKVFKERASETPAPDVLNVEKSFFLSTDGKPKTFLCGWAPEVAVGEFGELLFGHADHGSPHCTLQFEIEDPSWLVGRLVNPSFPNTRQGRKNWREYVRIPILSHFYYEKTKDQHGRETNEWIENSGRSDFSARPFMKLDLARIQILEPGFFHSKKMNDSLTHNTATEIEWDKANHFLGFTLNMSLGNDTSAQARVRVNFLRYEHDPKFKKLPYHAENSRLFNILHVMGQRHEVASELYAARWDVSSPVKFYINGTEDKRIQALLVAAVEKWNQVFVDEGILSKGQKAFEPIVQNREHIFDLRYPGINYVSDRRISGHNALGVGYAHADILNGKILWGNVLVFGGVLESVLQTYSQAESFDAGGSDLSIVKIFSGNSKAMRIPDRLFMPSSLTEMHLGNRAELQRALQVSGRSFLNQELLRLERTRADNKAGLEALSAQVNALDNSHFSAKVVADLTNQVQLLKQQTEAQFAGRTLFEMMGFTRGQSGEQPRSSLSQEDHERITGIIRQSKNSSERQQGLRGFIPTASSQFPDHDLTGKAIRMALNRSDITQKRSYKDILDGILTNLTLHEMGHVLGLGHQFKENILPREGSVPSAVFKDLKERATPERDFSNVTSVMGYPHGKNWIATDAKTFTPGGQDRLVLRYLYNSEYAAFDKSRDAFVYFKVPNHGRIPEVTKTQSATLPTSYFPQCNDIEASYQADPFCNRWDRGHNAETLVRTYFEDLTDNLVSDLYSFVGGHRRDPETHEWYLWARSFETLSRVRLFYDDLRLRLATDPELIPLWDSLRRDKTALYEFSGACSVQDEKDIVHPVLKELFFGRGQKSSEIRDLCRASKLALNEMKFLLTLQEADHSKIDTAERYVMGGYLIGDVEADQRQIIGKWYQLSNLPLKIASLYTLTAANAYLWPGYLNPFFATEGRAPLYRTLFPAEYTRTISDMAESNMRFESLEKAERNSLGQILLVSSWLLPRQNSESKDPGLLPSDFNEVLKNQTEFQISLAAVMITAAASQNDTKTKANHYKRFTATMFDFMLNRSRTAREVYLLPEGRVLVRVNDAFLYPLTRLRFLDNTTGYVLAIKVDYDTPVGDRLIEQSVKAKLSEQHEAVNTVCVNGLNNTGLSKFFNSTNEDEFEGFYIPAGIAEESGVEKTTEFYRSIETQFKKYEAKVAGQMTGLNRGKTMQAVCDKAIGGVGQISSAAALMSGHWLPITDLFRN